MVGSVRMRSANCAASRPKLFSCVAARLRTTPPSSAKNRHHDRNGEQQASAPPAMRRRRPPRPPAAARRPSSCAPRPGRSPARQARRDGAAGRRSARRPAACAGASAACRRALLAALRASRCRGQPRRAPPSDRRASRRRLPKASATSAPASAGMTSSSALDHAAGEDRQRGGEAEAEQGARDLPGERRTQTSRAYICGQAQSALSRARTKRRAAHCAVNGVCRGCRRDPAYVR